jgi:hypothetical protein
MELIPIIEASLSIFTVFTAFFIILSYLLYKLRGKSNEKPYLKELASDNLISIIVEKTEIIEDDAEKLKRFERFKVVNSVQAPTVTDEQPNEKINVLNTVAESYKASNIILKPQTVNNNLNIYNLYSNSSVRQMHKLHTPELTNIKKI